MSSAKIQHLQLLQQNLQNVQMQKQQLETQLIELDSALKELENTSQAYKIIGKIMIASSKEDLSKDLNEKKEVVNVRLKNFVSQEEKLKQNMEDVQKEVMEEMKQEKN